MSRQLTLIKTVVQVIKGENGNDKNIIVTTSSVLADKEILLLTKGCVDYIVLNTGSISAFLWEALELVPGGQFSMPKSTGLEYDSNIKFYFADDYQKTRNPVNAPTPPAIA